MNTSESQVIKKKSSINTTAIITWVICFLIWLIVWIFAQQMLSQKFTKDCTIPVKLDWNIPWQNIIQ